MFYSMLVIQFRQYHMVEIEDGLFGFCSNLPCGRRKSNLRRKSNRVKLNVIACMVTNILIHKRHYGIKYLARCASAQEECAKH